MSLRRVPRWPLLLVGLAGCGDATPAPTDAATVDVTAADSTLDAGPPPQCTAAIECDDGVACTVDQCVGGRCVPGVADGGWKSRHGTRFPDSI